MAREAAVPPSLAPRLIGREAVAAKDVRIPRVQRVRRRLSDDTVKYHYYHRPTGTRLPPPSDPAFKAAYDAAEAQLVRRRPTKEPRIVPDQALSLVTATNKQTLKFQSKPEPPLGEPTDDTKARLYLIPEEVSQRWREKITTETLANWRALQIGPSYSKFGKAVLYRLDLLEKWEEKNLVTCGLATVNECKD